jgi:AbrB family looped-hinge helix DNA binding protein
VSATVTSKGQITIPKAVREAVGVKPGRKVDFKPLDDGHIAIVKQGPKPKGRFDRFRGVATAALTTEETMALTRSRDWRSWSIPMLDILTDSATQ